MKQKRNSFSGVPIEEENPEVWDRKASQKLLNLGAENVIITLGKRGAYVATTSISKHFKTFEHIKAVDTQLLQEMHSMELLQLRFLREKKLVMQSYLLMRQDLWRHQGRGLNLRFATEQSWKSC